MTLAAVARPASAQWTRVSDVPQVTLNAVSVNGDTIVTSGDSLVYVSTNAGATWKTSSKVASGLLSVQRVRMRNGRIYAGTERKGVFVSDDLGGTWSDYNQGLVGGFLDTQLDINDMLIRGDTLYVATDSGVWLRNPRSGTWRVFGSVFAPDQASSLTFIAAGVSRLLTAGGFNGFGFFRDPGDPDWTLTLPFDNGQVAPGLALLSGIWTGSRWVVGSNIGVFLSATGQSEWTFVDPGAGRPLFVVPFAMHGRDLFANFGAFSSTIAVSHDEGGTWQLLEVLPVPVSGLAVQGNTLFASRLDGLWRRSLDDVAAVPPTRETGLSFAIASARPARGLVRFRFDLPDPGHASIHVFDVTGRRVGTVIDGAYPAGSNETAWDAQGLPPGVYHARLSFGSRAETVRFVRTQ